MRSINTTKGLRIYKIDNIFLISFAFLHKWKYSGLSTLLITFHTTIKVFRSVDYCKPNEPNMIPCPSNSIKLMQLFHELQGDCSLKSGFGELWERSRSTNFSKYFFDMRKFFLNTKSGTLLKHTYYFKTPFLSSASLKQSFSLFALVIFSFISTSFLSSPVFVWLSFMHW